MLQAVLLGLFSQSSLLLSGLVVYWIRVPRRVIGWLAGFGAGALISAIAFDLVSQAEVLGHFSLTLWLLLGAGIFLGGDKLVSRYFGGDGTSSALGIVLGAVVDGVPESLIFGMQVASGNNISAAFLAAVMVSNIPQALAPSAELAQAGWRWQKQVVMWGSVVLACGVTAGLGYFLATGLNDTRLAAQAAAIAAGGLLAMLTTSLMPFAFERGGNLSGIWTVVGFAFALSLG